MEKGIQSPFGDYGIIIINLTFKGIVDRKIDITKMIDADYLIERRYNFNVIQWSPHDLDYVRILSFNGDNFVNIRGEKQLLSEAYISPAHIWLKNEKEFQDWLGEYYNNVITTILSNENKEELNKDSIFDNMRQYYQNQIYNSNNSNSMIGPNYGNPTIGTTVVQHQALKSFKNCFSDIFVNEINNAEKSDKE